jgi:hypothetical protein
MRRVSTGFFVGRSLALIAAIALSAQVLAADVRPRDPSIGERVRSLIHCVVNIFSDQLIVPPA